MGTNPMVTSPVIRAPAGKGLVQRTICPCYSRARIDVTPDRPKLAPRAIRVIEATERRVSWRRSRTVLVLSAASAALGATGTDKLTVKM